jgi:hypothetical protein
MGMNDFNSYENYNILITKQFNKKYNIEKFDSTKNYKLTLEEQSQYILHLDGVASA